MKIFEIVYFNLRYFLPSLNLFIYKKVKHLARLKGNDVSLLDIGGRKSHYTINIPAEITVTDIPRESNIQVKLNLGVNENIINQLYSRRSNIKDYLIDHMVDTKLPKKSFDIVIAIEVLEHVEEDKTFINNVYDTLKPGGIYFMTTPNGDHVENTNPDHIRHYTKKQLFSILTSRFEIVDIEYAIYEDQKYFHSLKSWDLGNPFQTIRSIYSSIVNNYHSNYSKNPLYAKNSRHLSAVCRKAP